MTSEGPRGDFPRAAGGSDRQPRPGFSGWRRRGLLPCPYPSASTAAVDLTAGQLAARVVNTRTGAWSGDAIGGGLVTRRICNVISPIVGHSGFFDGPTNAK